MSKFEIRELSDNDWREYRSIRLESLRDSPDSFASTFAREDLFGPEQWKSRLRISRTIHDAVAFSAIADHLFIGLVSCVIQDPETHNAHLYQMWVSPEYRNIGVGSALLDRVKPWAASRGIESLRLSVTTVNIEAISLYKSSGFNSVGNTEPLRKGSELQSQNMELKFNAGDA